MQVVLCSRNLCRFSLQLDSPGCSCCVWWDHTGSAASSVLWCPQCHLEISLHSIWNWERKISTNPQVSSPVYKLKQVNQNIPHSVSNFKIIDGWATQPEFIELNELILAISQWWHSQRNCCSHGCRAGAECLCSPWTAEVLQTQLFIPKWEFCSNYLRFVTLENHFAQGFCHGDKQTVILFALVFEIIIIIVEYLLLFFPLQCCSNILERYLEGLNPLWSVLKTYPAGF